MNRGSSTPAIARRLNILRRRIADANIPTSELGQTFVLATWNIREFDAATRVDRSFHCIGEIISRFDLLLIAAMDSVTDGYAGRTERSSVVANALSKRV